MRRWPWLLAAVLLAAGAVVVLPRAEVYTAQSEGTDGATTGGAPFPLATLLLALSAGVCLAAGFRPQSRAVQRALGREPDASQGGLHAKSADVLARLRRP